MWPWIVLTAVGLVLEILNILMTPIFLHPTPLFLITSVIFLVLGAYFFLVVWSFKAEVEEGAGGDYQGQVHYKREEREMLKA